MKKNVILIDLLKYRYLQLDPVPIPWAKQKDGCIIKFIINDAMQDDDVIVQSHIYRRPAEYPMFKMQEIAKSLALPDFDVAFIGYECSTDTFENLKALGPFIEVQSK